MTTYEELTACRRANRRHHNQAVRFRIALYRETFLRSKNHSSKEYLLSMKLEGIRKALRERSAMNFLEDFSKPPCGTCSFCEAHKRLKRLA